MVLHVSGLIPHFLFFSIFSLFLFWFIKQHLIGQSHETVVSTSSDTPRGVNSMILDAEHKETIEGVDVHIKVCFWSVS